MSVITFMSDFSLRDYYVGAVKGVMLGIAPDVTLVDITHQLQPHNVFHAALVLGQTIEWYPKGTVHLAVVDPGVGGTRCVLAGRYVGQTIVAPDNGLLTLVHRRWPVEALHVVENAELFRPAVSHTFHGRDIMAPAAAHLARGMPIERMGRPAGSMELLRWPEVDRTDPDALSGCVIDVDHFGNLVSNLSQQDVAGFLRRADDFRVRLGNVDIGPILRTYTDVERGEPLAVIGGTGLLEVAVRDGRAVDRFPESRDATVVVRRM